MTQLEQQSGTERPPLITRYTFKYHLRGVALEMLFAGIFGLNEVVARKGLGASQVQITLLTTASTGFLIFAFLFGSLMDNRPKKPWIIWSAILGHGALFFVAFTSESLIFILYCCAVYASSAVLIPAQNSILQSNYNAGWRGRMLGKVTLWTRWLLPITAIVCGEILNRDPQMYRILFPIAAVMGMVSWFCYAAIRIRYRPVKDRRNKERKFLEVLKKNPDFDRYERNFMLYGVAFIMILPVNVFLLVDHLKMDYREFSITKIAVFSALVMLFSPLAGRLFDRLKAIRAAGVAFLVLSLHPLSLFLAWYFHSLPLAILSYAIFGMAMAGVMQAWVLGSMYFSGKSDAAPFMGVHVASVGIRGLCAPVIGHALYLLVGMGVTYLISTALFLVGSVLMFRLATSRRKASETSSAA